MFGKLHANTGPYSAVHLARTYNNKLTVRLCLGEQDNWALGRCGTSFTEMFVMGQELSLAQQCHSAEGPAVV